MSDHYYAPDNMEDEHIDIKAIIYKYLRFWPWFVMATLVTVLSAFLYLKYATVIYKTEAKIKIIDDKDAPEMSLDIEKLFNKSSIKLENEIALLSSYRLCEQVVDQLNLNIKYFKSDKFTNKEIFDAPFQIQLAVPEANLEMPLNYTIEVLENGYRITNEDSDASMTTSGFWYTANNANFPVNINPKVTADLKTLENTSYFVAINTIENTTQSLRRALKIGADGKNSDVLVLSMDYNNGEKAQEIINTLIEVYEQDGIIDRQEISKRTISFVDERFEFLLTELDSIEFSKKEFKQDNNISFIEADASATILKRGLKDEALFNAETQLLVSDILKTTIDNSPEFQLLPNNIGLESASINQLVESYNTAILEYDKLRFSAGVNNPNLKLLIRTIKELRANITQSVNGYIQQLIATLSQNKAEQKTTLGSFASLPQKEQILRNIERQQNLKENLYLLLLQKREEAAINLAITVSNVKVIDYGITAVIPISPKKSIIYLASLLLGLLIPFGVIYAIFSLDTKIHNGKDIEAINNATPVLAEIPTLSNKNNQAELDEVFRTLIYNAQYIAPKTDDGVGKSFLITSAVKGEGKTFVAMNFARALANLKKKVILVGADIRNPQLHTHLSTHKNQKGLTNYIHEEIDWQPLLQKNQLDSDALDVLLSGDIPPNPTVLLSSPRFGALIEELKTVYDYVIIDSAPTLLVSDTLIIAKHADTTLYVSRSSYTEKELIEYSTKLIKDQKLNNVGYLVNGIKRNGYNYGYGYGYNEAIQKKKWYQFFS